MILIENKLEMYKKLVFNKIKQEYDTMILDLDNKNAIILDKIKKELKDERKNFIDKRVELINKEEHIKISNTKSELKQLTLEKEQELLIDLEKSIKIKAFDYWKNKDDAKKQIIILKGLSSIEDKVIDLHIPEYDIQSLSPFISDFADKNNKIINIKPLDEKYLGGFLVSIQNNTYSMDFTILGKIENNRYIIGKFLHNSIFKKEVK